MSFGNGSNRFSQDIDPASRAGGLASIVVACSMGFFTSLRTGCQWNAAPSEFGSSSTLHRYFQEWTEKGVFFRLWKEALWEYDALEWIDWGWQSLDGAMTKAPLGGEKNGPQPHGSRQIRNQAFPSYGWRRRSAGPGRVGREYA